MASCRNADLTDREMLANIVDVGDDDGYATTTDIGLKCGYTGSNGNGRRGNQQRTATPAQRVASRLCWMRDGGLLESFAPDRTTPYIEPGDRDTRWRPTEIGYMILDGKLSKAVQTGLERMDAGSMLLAMRELMTIGYIRGGQTEAFALRREIQHHQAQRSLKIR